MNECLDLPDHFFSRVIKICQDIFIDELKLEQNIAKNDALKENVWMMAICIELRIPLFLVSIF
jgi:E3 ubiquitin-protein ligase RNF213